MECFWCGSFNHSADRCPGIEPEMKRNEKGQYLCPKCGRAWGQNNYAIECYKKFCKEKYKTKIVL